MMSSTEQDPFLQVQGDVQTLIAQTRQQFSSYLRIRSLQQPRNNGPTPELKSAKEELEATLQDLSTDLSDLHESVKAVELDPYAYGLDIEEVSRRRNFVREIEGEVEDMMEELKKEVERVKESAHHDPYGVDGDGYGDEEEGGYAAWEQERQVQIMREQDEVLEDVGRSINVLRQTAHAMGEELAEQGEILDRVDEDADRIDAKLKMGMQRMTNFLKKNEDTWSSCFIAVLIFVLILLLIFLLVL
ncbi:hypothetical protein BJ508DRAFT_115184 [Ascobolus immersus RN42]|uniref:t-SNARE coiled-coil homology domain-containing protein n=1 Tax=Ascobolus immersus RN42 TaxID=1160509 RepID=A0A3N4IHQ4_ASCIM|nr:hypothetical protein BJ508DRAFT_115184 [Ascobolus immersus RN42]